VADDSFSDQTVDLVAVSPDGSEAMIFLIQSGAWTGTDSQVTSLQSKIHNYVGFALDGQMVQSYPEVVGLPWVIVVDCQTGPPDPRSSQVISHAAEAVKKYGGEVRIKPFERA
jgi:hypothetical protein